MEYRIIYHDSMPMMADVFSGTYTRPTELPTGEDFMSLLDGSLALERIHRSVGKSIRMIATRSGEPIAYTAQVDELRRHQDLDSAIALVGHTLIAFNVDATNYATLDVARTKQYSDDLQAAAMDLVRKSGADITEKVNLRPLAKNLVESTGCSYNIAKQHVAKAVRRQRGELVERGWGGKREDAGRPPKEEAESQ